MIPGFDHIFQHSLRHPAKDRSGSHILQGANNLDATTTGLFIVGSLIPGGYKLLNIKDLQAS